VTFGVTGDRDSTPDIDVLVHGIEAGLAELVAAAREATAPRPKAALARGRR
jgi:diacylglycerol O-acyltransferase / wax synthase